MILAHIITHNKEQALKIIHLLMDKKLILQAAVSEKIIYQKKTPNSALISTTQSLVTCKTKALLFNTINNILKTNFNKTMPILYAVPIVYMDEELTILLRENTVQV